MSRMTASTEDSLLTTGSDFSANSPAHHKHITRDRFSSCPESDEKRDRVVAISTQYDEAQIAALKSCSIASFQTNGGVLLQGLKDKDNYFKLFKITDKYDPEIIATFNTDINTRRKARGQAAPPEVAVWHLHGMTSNIFRVVGRHLGMVTCSFDRADSSALLTIFRDFCSGLDESNSSIAALLCSETLCPEGLIVYHCIFFPKDEDSWKAFKESEIYVGVRTQLQPMTTSASSMPIINEYQCIAAWDLEGKAVPVQDESAEEVPPPAIVNNKSPDAAAPTPASPAPIATPEGGIVAKKESTEAVAAEGLDLSDKPELQRFEGFLKHRMERIYEARDNFVGCKTTGTAKGFKEACASGAKFGCIATQGAVEFRDWVTGGVQEMYVRGEFSNWEDCPMVPDDEDLYGYHSWVYSVKDVAGKNPVKEDTKYQFKIVTSSGDVHYRVPAYARGVMVEPLEGHVDARVFFDDSSSLHASPRPATLRRGGPVRPVVYECHLGICSESQDRIGSFKEFKEAVLPRVKKGGFNTICFMGVLQHSSYSTFGWHVTQHYAPDAAFGSPSDLHELIDECHKEGIRVWISMIHSHCAPIPGGLHQYMAQDEGNAEGYCYAGGLETMCQRFDAKKFALERHEVMRYLLGSIYFWATEYKIDGIRMENLQTMLFRHQGLSLDFAMMPLSRHFDHDADINAHVHLALVAMLCNELDITCTAATECESPTLTRDISNGGLGFDYIFSSAPQKVLRKLAEDFSIGGLAQMANCQSDNETIFSITNWDSNLYAKRPLKIAMTAWETMHTHPVGGVAPHVTELAAGLARIGHEVHIFTRSTTAGSNYMVQHGVHIHECPMTLNEDFVQEIKNMCSSLQGHLLQTEAYMNDRFAIVHAHDWLAGPSLENLGSGRTTVQTMHSTEFGRCGNKIHEGQSKRVRAIEHGACDRADRVICVSGVLADEVKQLFSVHPEKIRVVYNGINATNWDGFEDGATIKARYGISAMQPMLLFVGRMVIQKGPDLLVEALPEIVKHRSDVCVVMVGDGHMLEDLKRKTDAMGLSNNVKWLGKKGGAELKSLYKACDAVLVPSRNEPFGIVVLEAWACYKPVVATTCGGPRDFVSHDHEGYLVDPDPASVAWGCKKILSNFEHTRWMGERGRVKAAFSFTWDRIALETRDVYLELLNRQDAPYGITQHVAKTGEQSFISSLVGPLLTYRMSVFDQCQEVQSGLDRYNMLRLFTGIASNGGVMSFMGTEFGQPDVYDMPRPGNHFSKEKAVTDWSLGTTTDLKFKYMHYFNAKMNELIASLPDEELRIVNEDDCSKTLVVQKGDVSFVFNFGIESFDSFDVGFERANMSKLKILACSAEPRFSGREVDYDLSTPVELVKVTSANPSTNPCEDGFVEEKTYMGCPFKYSIPLPSESVVIVGEASFPGLDSVPVDAWITALHKECEARRTIEPSVPVLEKKVSKGGRPRS